LLRDKLENGLTALEEVYLNGSPTERLPHVCNLSFRFVESESMMMGFGKDLAVSSGSACTSASIEPSYVLKALGLDDDMAHGSIRFALGRFNTEEEIDYAIQQVSKTLMTVRQTSPLWQMFKEELKHSD
jgi:cysteine desulfurase